MATELMESPQRHQSAELSVDMVLERVGRIQDLMARAMRPDIDYGQIPGTNSKPTLLKPGAEKLSVMFRLAPKYHTKKTFEDTGHLTVESTCEILDLNGNFLGEASAMCSTKESKYAYRKGERKCPNCGKSAIIKGKAEYGGGWLCWKKKDGCGMQYNDDDQDITSQQVGRIPNPDLPDSYHAVVRIAEKRAFVGAMRLVTGASALFDEEIPGEAERDHDSPPEPKATPAPEQEPPKTNGAANGTHITGEEWNQTKAELAKLDVPQQQFLAQPMLAKLGVKFPRDIPRTALAPAMQVARHMSSWTHWLKDEMGPDAFNNGVRDLDDPSIPEDAKPVLWEMVIEGAKERGFVLDDDSKLFKVAERKAS